MLTAFKIALLVLSIGLIIVVLLQKGKSAGLSGAITGGAEHLFGRTKARGLDLFLSRVTLVLAILFIVLTAVIAYSDEIPWLAEEKPAVNESAAPQTNVAPPASNTDNSQTIQVTTPPADSKSTDADAKKPATQTNPSSTEQQPASSSEQAPSEGANN